MRIILLKVCVSLMAWAQSFEAHADSPLDHRANECNCSAPMLESINTQASVVFVGKVLQGYLDPESNLITFHVDVSRVLRGEAGEQVELTTLLDRRCGMNVIAGESRVFMLAPEQVSVTRCHLPTDSTAQNIELFASAFLILDYYRNEDPKAQDILESYAQPGQAAQPLISLLELVLKLDSTAPVSMSHDVLRFHTFTAQLSHQRIASYEKH